MSCNIYPADGVELTFAWELGHRLIGVEASYCRTGGGTVELIILVLLDGPRCAGKSLVVVPRAKIISFIGTSAMWHHKREKNQRLASALGRNKIIDEALSEWSAIYHAPCLSSAPSCVFTPCQRLRSGAFCSVLVMARMIPSRFGLVDRVILLNTAF